MDARPSDTPDIETRRATRLDLDEASSLLAAAFIDYPWTRWTVEHQDREDHLHRLTALQRLALEHYALPFGEVWVTTRLGVVECVAAWNDSAVETPPSVELEVRHQTAELEGCRHAASRYAASQLQGWRPKERHFYLGTIGTRPSSQRRGLARQTLAPVLRRADAHRIAGFLETSSASNVAFYSALGFRVVDHKVINGGGPDVWAMLRDPVRPDVRLGKGSP